MWTKPRQGLCGFLVWLGVVFAAAFSFASAMTAIFFFLAPGLFFAWSDGFSYSFWKLGLVPALIGLKVMALFMAAVLAAFVLYRALRRVFNLESETQDEIVLPAEEHSCRGTHPMTRTRELAQEAQVKD